MYWLQKGAKMLFMIALSFLIFFVLVSDKKTRQHVLRPTLEALGERLFAAVRDDSERQELEANYRTFMAEAEAQEIAPEKVEELAAGILNLSSRDSVISSQDALRLLEESRAVAEDNSSPGSSEKQNDERRPPGRASSGFPIRRVPEPAWSKEEMAQRLKAMQEFQQEMERLARDPAHREMLERRYHFQPSDSGIRVFVDVQLKDALRERDALLMEQLKDMEKKQWLKWGHTPPPPPPKRVGDAKDDEDSVRIRIGVYGRGIGQGLIDRVPKRLAGGITIAADGPDSVRLMINSRELAELEEKLARVYYDSSLLRKLEEGETGSLPRSFHFEWTPTRPDSTKPPQP
jgi:hypothetical protein